MPSSALHPVVSLQPWVRLEVGCRVGASACATQPSRIPHSYEIRPSWELLTIGLWLLTNLCEYMSLNKSTSNDFNRILPHAPNIHHAFGTFISQLICKHLQNGPLVCCKVFRHLHLKFHT